MSGARYLWMGAVLVSLALQTSCKKKEAHEHASEHPEGHDHHAEGHGHGELPVVRITRWGDQFELFAEHSPAIKGKEVTLLAHLTVLDGFRPLDAGKLELELELEGTAPARASATGPTRPGIFQLTFVPQSSGKYRGRLVVTGTAASTVDGLEIQVFESEEKAAAAVPKEEPGSFIELLKEQQWGVPFATAFAKQGSISASIEVSGTVTTPPGGSADVGAPIAGLIVAPPSGLPRPGQAIRKGQVLASLAPAPSSPEEAARGNLAVTEAEARASRAKASLLRAERLIRDEAISQQELEDARREASVAEEAVRSARSARQLFSGAQGAGSGSWRLVAPIQGTLVDVRATPGAAVSPGEVLFRLVDTRELWIRARVPEQDATRLRTDRDASFQLSGLESWLPIDVTGENANASLVTLGRTVDPTSRTVDVIYALREADPNLRVGGLVRVSLPTGDDFAGIVVPRGALVDNDGREVVYVQVDGEHFEERAIRTGPRQGERVGIVEGLKGEERVVVRGANVVRLASKASTGVPHGHIH